MQDGWERVASCDLCGGRAFEPRATYPEYLLFTGERFSLVRCRGCQLCFINPRPSREAIHRYYPDDYEAHNAVVAAPKAWQRTVIMGDLSSLGWAKRAWLRVREDIAWYALPRSRGDRRILDLGAGSGKMLDLLRPLGWDTYAVELSPAAAARARAKGHKAEVGSVEHQHFVGESFDVVYMWHVLEHVHEPSLALASAHQSLRPGGQLMLCVPNFNSLQSRIFRQFWWSSDAPRHLLQFTRKTLKCYLERAGFTNIRMTTRTGATSWVRGLRHTINGLAGTRWKTDPPWLIDAFDAFVACGSIVRFLGAGSELRVTCERPT